jgi:hypothetical protein
MTSTRARPLFTAVIIGFGLSLGIGCSRPNLADTSLATLDMATPPRPPILTVLK